MARYAVIEAGSKPAVMPKRIHTRPYRLDALRRRYSEDPAFSHLRYGNRMLPGEGNPFPRLVFVVESPTQQDVIKGRYLSGGERLLLDDGLKAMDLSPDKTYLTSLVKYATPNNRCAKHEEMLASMLYLNDELDVLKATIVVVFGRHLNEWMFPEVNLIHQHGLLVEGRHRFYVPMLHPEAALRNSDIRKAFYRDMGRLGSIV